jgi:hypothetical protein
VPDSEALGDETVLGPHHVVVVVVREPRAQPVARLARAAVADRIDQDHEVGRCVERLTGAEQLAGENGREKLARGAAGAVDGEDRVPARRAARDVVQPQLG